MRFSAKRSAYSARTSKISGVVLGGRCKMLRDRRTWRHGATYQVPTVIKPNPRDGQQLGHVAAAAIWPLGLPQASVRCQGQTPALHHR
jgi:hypothetical protein